jgi:CCR4-NOT complex subunit CAF16
MSEQPSVVLDHVHFRYVDTPGGVSDIHLTLEKGARVLLIGHNGSGKSTLLSLVGGRRMAAKGTVTVLGSDAFQDTTLNASVSLIGIPWPTEAFFANTVDNVAAPAPFPERKADIARRLHLPLKAHVDKMSSGEKRRVQILHGMLRPAKVYLLDECSTDIDVAERATVLQLIKDECVGLGACCIYATHILDGVKDWATHVALVADGKLISYHSTKDIDVSLDSFAHTFMAKKTCQPFESYVSSALGGPAAAGIPSAQDESVAAADDESTKSIETAFLAAAEGCSYVTNDEEVPVVISCNQMNYKNLFANLTFAIRRGSRTLLLGCNGSGKSTLLNMMGGKQFFNNSSGALTIFNKVAYDDMTLNGKIAYCGDWWVKTPGGEMHVHQMLPKTATEAGITKRGELLIKLLDIDINWDVRHISAGEQKRVQLLLFMYEDKPLIILDEATADLDVDQRHELLKFLYLESALRGVTVVYTTHIFEGLRGWATDCIILDRTTKGVGKEIHGSENVCFDVITQTLIDFKANEVFE